mgnify:CR=1 FL=1
MNLLKELKEALKLIQFDKDVISSVVGRKSATSYGFLIIFLAPILSVFISAFSYPSGIGAMFSKFLFWPLMIPFMSLAIVYFLQSFYLKKLFKVNINYLGLFRVLSYVSIVFWLIIIFFVLNLVDFTLGDNFFNLLFYFAFFVVFFFNYRFLDLVFKLKKRDLYTVILLTIFSYFIVNLIFGNLLVGDSYRLFY